MAFVDPPYRQINDTNKFSNTEVGITHPNNSAYLKIADNGDIFLMADNNLGIIISASRNCIFLVGDTIKFLTKEDEGLRLNNLAFNTKATSFNEPAFIYPKNRSEGLYSGVSKFFG